MTTSLQDRWTDLEVEAAKLKAEAEVRGESAVQSISKLIEDVEAKAAEAKAKLDAGAEAGADDARSSLDHLEAAFDSAKTAVQDAWRELRK